MNLCQIKRVFVCEAGEFDLQDCCKFFHAKAGFDGDCVHYLDRVCNSVEARKDRVWKEIMEEEDEE